MLWGITTAHSVTVYLFSRGFSVSMIQLYFLMGVWPMLGALFVVIISTVINAWLGLLQQRLQKKILAFKGTRTKILNEVITGIKVSIIMEIKHSLTRKKNQCSI